MSEGRHVREGGRSLRLGIAVGVTVLAAALFVIPRDYFTGGEALLGWGVPSELAMHVLICAVVTFAWTPVLRGVHPVRLVLWGVLLAVSTEALQLLPSVERGANVGDIGANVLGIGLGWLVAMAVRWGERFWRERAGAASTA